jgi:hypothetical protein
MQKHETNASYYPAEALLKEIEVEIGGQRVDKIYNDWFRVYDELYRSGSEKEAYRSMVDFDDPSAGGDTNVTKRFYVPLIFFYNKAPGLALPLVALQYHEVKLNILFENATNMANAGVDPTVEPTCQLFSTFVYLDTEERKRFSQQSHEVRSISKPSFFQSVSLYESIPSHTSLFLFAVLDHYSPAHRCRDRDPRIFRQNPQHSFVTEPSSSRIVLGY